MPKALTNPWHAGVVTAEIVRFWRHTTQQIERRKTPPFSTPKESFGLPSCHLACLGLRSRTCTASPPTHTRARMSWYPPSRTPVLDSFFCLSLACPPRKRPDPSMRFCMPDARQTKRGIDQSLECGLCGRNHIRTHGGGREGEEGGEAAQIGQPHNPSSFLSLSLAILPCKRSNG